MSVARITELSATSQTSFEDAIQQAISRATSTLRGVEGAWRYAGEGWNARVEAIYQDPRDLADDSLLLRRSRHWPRGGATARAAGVLSIMLWLSVITAGRLIGYR